MDDESTGAPEQTADAPEIVTGSIPVAAVAPALTALPGTPGVGVTSVSGEVIQKIAAAAARAVPGVVDLGGDVARLLDTVLDKIGLDEVGDATRGVTARVTGTDVSVRVVLVLETGRTVPEVTQGVRAAVTQALQGYGLQVTGVDVIVDDLATS